MKSILSEKRDLTILILEYDEEAKEKQLFGFDNIREVHIVDGDGPVAIFADEADAKAFEAMRAEKAQERLQNAGN